MPDVSFSPIHLLRISTTDGVPIYLQIVNQVKYLVASGRLEPGTEMPTIRHLAEQLVINPNTVARAYRELETSGLVEKRRTSGTFVTDGGSRLAAIERKRILAERIDTLLAEARHLDVPVSEVLSLIRERDALLSEGEAVK